MPRQQQQQQQQQQQRQRPQPHLIAFAVIPAQAGIQFLQWELPTEQRVPAQALAASRVRAESTPAQIDPDQMMIAAIRDCRVGAFACRPEHPGVA